MPQGQKQQLFHKKPKKQKAKTSAKKVDKKTIEQLLEAAVHAPNGMFTQPWVFGVIQDKNLLKHISDECKTSFLRQFGDSERMQQYREMLENPDFDMFYNAGTLILICFKAGISPTAEIDCHLAAENLMLMARDLGLGTCWIGFAGVWLNTPEGKNALGIPDDVTVAAPIIVGYPAEEPPARPRSEPIVLFWK